MRWTVYLFRLVLPRLTTGAANMLRQTYCGKLIWGPVAGAGVGLDALAFMSWFQCGGRKKLYDRLWDGKGVDVQSFILRPFGPEALGCSAKEMKDVVIIELTAPCQEYIKNHCAQLSIDPEVFSPEDFLDLILNSTAMKITENWISACYASERYR